MRTPPHEMTCGFLIQLVFCKKKKKKTRWFIGVEVEQETSATPPKKKSWIRPCVFLHTNSDRFANSGALAREARLRSTMGK